MSESMRTGQAITSETTKSSRPGRHARPGSRRALAIGAAATVAAALLTGIGVSSSAMGATPAVKAPTVVHVYKGKVGKILVTAKGLTIYAFAKDAKNKSRCTGVCLQYWPAVAAKQASKPHAAGITAKFGVLKRSNGFKQLTVNGYPAYTYAGDAKAGALNGQGVLASGAKWWVIAPNGKWIKTMPKASPSPTVSPTGTPIPTPTYTIPN